MPCMGNSCYWGLYIEGMVIANIYLALSMCQGNMTLISFCWAPPMLSLFCFLGVGGVGNKTLFKSALVIWSYLENFKLGRNLVCQIITLLYVSIFMGFPDGAVVKNLPASARDMGLMPDPGRSPGEGNGNPLQCFCLGNPMDRGAWQAIVHGIANESDMTEHAHTTLICLCIHICCISVRRKFIGRRLSQVPKNLFLKQPWVLRSQTFSS